MCVFNRACFHVVVRLFVRVFVYGYLCVCVCIWLCVACGSLRVCLHVYMCVLRVFVVCAFLFLICWPRLYVCVFVYLCGFLFVRDDVVV